MSLRERREGGKRETGEKGRGHGAKRGSDIKDRAACGSVMDTAYWILHNETVQQYPREGQVGEVMCKYLEPPGFRIIAYVPQN